MQIYNERIFDLLQDKRREHPLQLREAARGSHVSVHVLGLSSYRVLCPDDVFRLLRRGVRNRAVRSTEENSESSRSHSVLQLEVQVTCRDEVSGGTSLRRATLSLVDLAGSEKWRAALSQVGSSYTYTRTHIYTYIYSLSLHSFQHLYFSSQTGTGAADERKELFSINSSLHALGACVSALLETNRRHIPYRNSCLTRLLQDAIGGSGRTFLVATVRCGNAYMEETLSTLQFAARAAKVQGLLYSSVPSGMGGGTTRTG